MDADSLELIMSSTDDRGCIRAGEESPGFTGQDAG